MSPSVIEQDGVLLEAHGIGKTFPGVVALDDVSIMVHRGEVHGLVGKNGAGKSTLIKIISGIYAPDAGRVCFDGVEYGTISPGEARSLGIQVVPQEQQFQPYLTVAENFFVGNWPKTPAGLVDVREMHARTKEALAQLQVDISTEALAGELPLVQRQILAIAKAIFSKAKLIILDEPTPSLTQAEVELLFRYVRELASRGTTFVYISHYLNEIFEVCDSVSVLRNGKLVHSGSTSELTAPQLVEHMIGKAIDHQQSKRHVTLGDDVLTTEGLTSPGRFYDVNLSLRKGEVVGLAGLLGCGSHELAKALCGLAPISSGRMEVIGKSVEITSPEVALREGIAFLPEDRRELGLILNMPVHANINLSVLKRLVNRFGLIRDSSAMEKARRYVSMLRIATPSLSQEVRFLSGGNQQKVVVARLLNAAPRILVMLDPTAGIDVEAKAEIHKLMGRLADDGLSILFLSSDINEMIEISDRILVMHQGRIVAEYDHQEASRRKILVASEGMMET